MNESSSSKRHKVSSSSESEEFEDSYHHNNGSPVGPITWAKFVRSLFEMASCESNAQSVGFSTDGLSLEIRDSARLSSEVLPKYFKHRNVSSVIRQLSNYGFKKTSASSTSSLQSFMHENFRRGRMDLLGYISRRGSVDKKDVKELRKEIEALKKKEAEQERIIRDLQNQNSQYADQNRSLIDENKRLLSGVFFKEPAHPNHSNYLTSPHQSKSRVSISSHVSHHIRPPTLNLFGNFSSETPTSPHSNFFDSLLTPHAQLTPHSQFHSQLTPSNRPSLNHFALYPNSGMHQDNVMNHVPAIATQDFQD